MEIHSVLHSRDRSFRRRANFCYQNKGKLSTGDAISKYFKTKIAIASFALGPLIFIGNMIVVNYRNVIKVQADFPLNRLPVASRKEALNKIKTRYEEGIIICKGLDPLQHDPVGGLPAGERGAAFAKYESWKNEVNRLFDDYPELKEEKNRFNVTPNWEERQKKLDALYVTLTGVKPCP